MKLAVITTGGKQYLVKEGDTLRVEKLEAKDGETMTFAPLMVAEDTGSEAKVGNPTLAGASVTAKIAGQTRADKIMVVKYHAKTRYKRNIGHKQHMTEIQIEKITA
jgi:large subunit ribosomal protein L21